MFWLRRLCAWCTSTYPVPGVRRRSGTVAAGHGLERVRVRMGCAWELVSHNKEVLLFGLDFGVSGIHIYTGESTAGFDSSVQQAPAGPITLRVCTRQQQHSPYVGRTGR